eukprot:14065231-Alexandrium_andersonii.AAC.1
MYARCSELRAAGSQRSRGSGLGLMRSLRAFNALSAECWCHAALWGVRTRGVMMYRTTRGEW